MKPEAFTAFLHYDAIAYDLYPRPQGLSVDAWEQHIRDRNAEMAYPTYERALKWLSENGHQDRFVNCYDNTDHTKGVGQIAIVVNDRDTALMLKLALG